MVCDSVANFEVVLASGEIVNANKDVNADLWQALKGGSNNFGIVTRIDLKTFDNPGIWAGMVAYPHSTAPLHAKALVHFTDKLEEDPYATMIHCIQYSPALGQTIIANAYVYSKPIARAPIYDEFLAIPGNFSDDTKVTTMSAFTAGAVEHPEGYRVIFVTATFQNDERVMQKAIELQDLMVEELKKVSEDWWSLSVFQPLPTLYAKHSAANGGNVLGLDRFDENAILFLVDLGWKGAEFDGAFEGAAQKLTDDIDEFAKSIGKGNEWIYLDYAYKTQKPLESYGAANVEKIRKVAAKYDPDGVFQKLVPGGFKVSKVPNSPSEENNKGHDEL
ncbi:FAD binding domain containing protein [Neofusicoccum parvum]|nr:FAD binding domain containing protein [Neofusicoccum parvum]